MNLTPFLQRLDAYEKLVRLDKPIGILLLLWPTLWGLWIAARGVPNLWALNFLLEESLGGGGTVSLHIDAQGKTYSQALLRCRVAIPAALLETVAPPDRATSRELS